MQLPIEPTCKADCNQSSQLPRVLLAKESLANEAADYAAASLQSKPSVCNMKTVNNNKVLCKCLIGAHIAGCFKTSCKSFIDGFCCKNTADLAPTMMATSAFDKASERAALTQEGWLSGMTPRPMAVARNGILEESTSRRSSSSACENAAPFPTTRRGLDKANFDSISTQLQGSCLGVLGWALLDLQAVCQDLNSTILALCKSLLGKGVLIRLLKLLLEALGRGY